MGLGAVAGLFCVDLRKSSYLGEEMEQGSGPLALQSCRQLCVYCDFPWIISHVLKTAPLNVTQWKTNTLKGSVKSL